ncbi:uncharacterized protein LOC106085553, partial [Stomoxys calcitrans]|uniref:uncharacterized protein LOC106085553 n=1 Tax=Stomoxys calcitrans TaxID=35570 RepID=UPI0027E3AA31
SNKSFSNLRNLIVLLSDNKSTLKAAAETDRKPTVLIIFGHSDINAALHYLGKSLEDPISGETFVATVLVQESIKKDFEQKLQTLLKPFANADLEKSAEYLKALETVKKLNAQFLSVTGGAALVYDFTHEHLGGHVAGIVTLHTFRTAKEAISLVGKETLSFSNVSIWHENHAYAYEVVAGLKSNNFYINCFNMPLTLLEESAKQGKSHVMMEKNYHYETMPHNGQQKNIVFPIGSIFAN